MTAGGVAQIKLQGGATTKGTLWDLHAEALNTAFVPSHKVTLLIFYDRVYSWPYAWKDKERPIRDVLEQSGLRFDTADLEDGNDPLTRTKAKYEALLDDSLSPLEASEVLGVSVDEIIQRLEDRSLYGIPVRGGWRIPDFQFEDGRLLPGIEEVLPLLHEELHPIAIRNWLANPNPDLLVGKEVVSPRQWLLSGRDVTVVSRLAIDL